MKKYNLLNKTQCFPLCLAWLWWQQWILMDGGINEWRKCPNGSIHNPKSGGTLNCLRANEALREFLAENKDFDYLDSKLFESDEVLPAPDHWLIVLSRTSLCCLGCKCELNHSDYFTENIMMQNISLNLYGNKQSLNCIFQIVNERERRCRYFWSLCRL